MAKRFDMANITKQTMLCWIQTSIKWAIENSDKAYESIRSRLMDDGFSVNGWRYHQCKKLMRLHKQELFDMALDVVEIMYAN